MIVIEPFNRLTAPEFAASQITVYSAEEARQLLERKEIVPIDQVHSASWAPRVSVVDTARRGSYDR